MTKGLEKLNRNLERKSAFITGAGSGLGFAFASLLAENNWELHLADIDLDSLQKIKKSLFKAREIHLYPLDVSDKMAYHQIAEQMEQNDQGIDLLINNAGIGDGELFENYELKNWEWMIEINLMGVMYGTHYLLPILKKAKKGLIINIGSAAGFMNAPGMSAYNVAKAGVYALSETLFHELKPRGIHVSVVTPTFFKTNIMSQAAGSGKFRSFAERQMDQSKTNAQEMAEVVLKQAAKGKFHIIHPFEAKRNYFLKKWFPGVVNGLFEKMMKKFLS